MINIDYLKYFIFLSILIYFIFDFLDKRRMQDEREELIRLKTAAVVHNCTLSTISLLSVVYLLYPQMPAYVPLIFSVMAGMYSEILGKFYFRTKL